MPIGASALPMAAYSGFYESHEPPPSGYVRGIVPAHRDSHQNGQQSGYSLHNCCVDCHGRRGDTRPIVAQWRRSAASCEALVMLHQAMRSVLHWRTAMAIKMARGGGKFIRRRRLFQLM